MWNIPNIISLFRALLAAPAFYFVYNKNLPVSLVFFLAAYLSDILDGYIARKKNIITEYGKIIDPFADKLFVGLCALALFLNGSLPLWITCVIIGRDLLILLFGAIMSFKIKQAPPSNYVGKAAVIVIALALIFSLFDFSPIKDIFYILASIAALASFASYGFRALKSK